MPRRPRILIAILIVAIVAAIGGGVREWHQRPPIPPPQRTGAALTGVPRVVDDPTAKVVQLKGAKGRDVSRPHKPHLDEMGIATWHEVKPARGDDKSPRKPTLDEMGPGVEAIPASKSGPRSTLGKPGMRGGFKPRRR